MAHKKGRGGQVKTKERFSGGYRYPAKKYRCKMNSAPNCCGVQNENTAKDPKREICNRCYQSKRAKGHED